MKVALACDTLLSKNYQTKVMESLVMLFRDSEIFTLCHVPGKVEGPLEQKKIHSTFLSHFVKTEEDFWKWMPMAPGAAANLYIPCSFDLLICVGSGFSSMISHCKTTPKMTYLLSHYRWWPENKKWSQKMFRSFVKKSVEKSIEQSRIVVAANEHFVVEKSEAPSEVLLPPVKLERFPLFGEAQRNLIKETYWLADAQSFEEGEWESIEKSLKESGLKIRLLKSEPSFETGEYIADDQLAPLIANSKGILIGSKKVFSDLSIKVMACGRPVIMSVRSGLKQFLGDGEGLLSYNDLSELQSALDEFQLEKYRPEKIRGKALGFNDVKFKTKWNRFAQTYANQSI